MVWFSFGQNVLAPQKQPDVPDQLRNLKLVGSVEGSEALAQIKELHGIDIEMESAYIAEYVHDNERVIVWFSRTKSGSAGAALTERMLQAIERGDSVFGNLQRLTIGDQEVFQVDGPGGEHFFYNSKEQQENVVWLIVEATDALPILKEAFKSF